MGIAFADAAAAFYAVCEKYGHFGADDTEPRAVFGSRVAQVCDGRTADPLPTDADGWELFGERPGAWAVANELTAAAESALDAARRDPDAATRHMGWR